jgi:hypothetical protein
VGPRDAQKEAEGLSSWVDAVRTGRTFVTAGPLLALTRDGSSFRASARSQGNPVPVEIVANGQVIASGEGEVEAVVTESGWVAARCPARGAFAHTSPLVVGSPVREPESCAALCKLIEQTGAWVEEYGRFTNPKRKQALIDRCADAIRKLEGAL